jgi:hypothetical protein
MKSRHVRISEKGAQLLKDKAAAADLLFKISQNKTAFIRGEWILFKGGFVAMTTGIKHKQ